jgi:hypothetical protein
MAKLKMIKLPKAPKATASATVKERWLQRAAKIKAENAKRAALNKKSEALSKRIAEVRANWGRK